jgi:predicted metalloprotease with PDZ domain
LYNKYYKELNRGFTEKEFKDELAKFLGENMDDFFAKYVDGTEVTPLNETFGLLGINVESVGYAKPSFGASLREDGGKVIVRSIRTSSSAENAGLSVNDEIIGCNGYRVDQKAFEDFVAGLSAGDKFSILISRDEILLELEVSIENYLKPQYVFKVNGSDTKKTQLRNYWLRTI